MHRNVLRTIQEYHMLSPGEQVVVGFSGGADSVALLYFLHSISKEWQLSVTACHVNHNLRGAEADRDEEFCRGFCRQYGIPLEVYQIQAAAGAKEAGLSVEEYARNARYTIFEEMAQKRNGKVATAHTLSDKAETVLFHLIRGTGIKGLEGIPPVRSNIIRPLIRCSREEIEEFCRRNSLNYVTDSSNLSNLYTRNKIRHQIVPVCQEINPTFSTSLERLSRQAAMENDFMEQQAAEKEQQLRLTQNTWSRKGFLQLHPAMQRRVAALWLRQWGVQISEKKIEEMVQAVEEQETWELVKGKYFAVKDVIVLKTESKLRPYFEIPLAFGENSVYSGKKVRVLVQEYEKIENNCQDILKNVLDYDKINRTIVIRQKKDGDKIELQGTGHTRPLKKIFNEAKLTLEERACRVVLADETGPLWVEGFGAAQRAVPAKGSKWVVTIEVEEGI